VLIQYAFIVLSGFLLGIFFISILKKFSLNYNLLISKEIPLIGGVAIGLSFILVSLLSLFLYKVLSKELVGIIVASAMILFFGVIDDWRELSIWAKFLVQIIACSLLIFSGVRTQIVNIGNISNIIITFIWVLGITNAFNHLDVMDGVASGTAVIVCAAFFATVFLNNDINVCILTLSLIGVAISFLIYNWPPAKIYMGNSGSHFLGFSLAAIALVISYAPLERKIALLSPLLILGLPIFDTAFLIFMRIAKRRLPFKKSDDHLALRFLKLGYSKNKTLLIMLFLCVFFSLSGVAVSQISNPFAIGVVIFAIFIGLVVATKLSKVKVDA